LFILPIGNDRLQSLDFLQVGIWPYAGLLSDVHSVMLDDPVAGLNDFLKEGSGFVEQLIFDKLGGDCKSPRLWR
jgi:hypothetical protein